MKSLIKQLQVLSELNGAPAHERHVAHYLYEQSKPYADEVFKDNLGSVIARKGTQGPKIMIAGHMDEVGLLVTKITSEGFIKFQTLGGWFSQVMLAQSWQIVTSKGIVYGVTGVKPPHLIPLADRSKAIEIKSMYIDIGVKSKQEAEKLGVKIGDYIVPDTQFRVLGDGKHLVGKAWDNRSGSAVVLEVLKALKGHPNTVFGAYTVQEEVGLRGAKTATYKVTPDIAIAIDTGVGNDVPGGEKEEQTLGAGPQIVVYDAGLIAHKELRDFTIDLAKKNDIPYQESYVERGQTDAGAMHIAHQGAASIAICIPTRYMHSHISMIHIDDVLNTIKLVTKLIEALNQKTVDTLIYT